MARMRLALRRQWSLVAVGVILTLGAAWYVVRIVPPAHSITATVLLLPPTPSSTEAPANPYLQLGGLTAPAEILARAMSDPVVEAQLTSQGVSSEYTVTRDMNTSAPVLLVSIQDSSLETARESRDAVLKQVPATLFQLQNAIKVPESAMLTSAVVTKEGAVTLTYKNTIRALMMTLAFGLLGTLMISTLVDSVRSGKRQRTRISAKPDIARPRSEQHPDRLAELVPETRAQRRSRGAL